MSIKQFTLACCLFVSPLHCFLVTIEPAGTSQDTGKTIADSFEKALTIQCAQEIKRTIEASHKGIEVLVTRTIGSPSSQQQNAQTANRLNSDLYIYLSFFQETDVKPHCFIYRYSLGNDIQKQHKPLSFYALEDAYTTCLDKTIQCSEYFYTHMMKSHTVHEPCAIPYAPLKGIMCAALGLEIGLHIASDWKQTVNPLANLITSYHTYIS